MKYVFLVAFIVLVGLSIGVYKSFPTQQSEVPVIYWVTDPNPARNLQIEGFHKWMIDQGRFIEKDAATYEPRPEMIENGAYQILPDGRGALCEVLLKLDVANNDTTKKLIQSVSGVGGDIMDLGPLHRFADIGFLEDLTEDAQEMGFGLDKTYPAIAPDLQSKGKQYAFPCNVYVNMYWVNLDTFKKFGVEVPDPQWTIEDFERIGKEFDAKANKPDEPRKHFLMPYINNRILLRSLGGSMYNETYTRSNLDKGEFAETMRLIYKWTYVDHIIPSKAEQASFDTAGGYGGPVLQLFNQGNYAMFGMGRYALIQLRKFGNLNLTVVEPPTPEENGFRNSLTGTRCAGVYKGSKNKEYAKMFLTYLASKDYNMQIVRDADALPPNPVYTEIDEYNAPADFPNEGKIHTLFAEAVKNIAIPQARCPFVKDNIANKAFSDAHDGVMNDKIGPEEAALAAAEAVNLDIERNLQADPKLRAYYDEQMVKQKKIIQDLV